MRKDFRGEAMSSINVTPLTDVLLVLLITFLLTATSFQSPDVEQPLPRVADAEELAERATILSVDLKARVMWPEPLRQGESLDEGFERLLKESARPTLALAVHRDLMYQDLYPILVAARQAGWEQIVLLTEEES